MGEVTYAEKGDACAWYGRLPAQAERVRKAGLDSQFVGPLFDLMERAAGRIESCGQRTASEG